MTPEERNLVIELFDRLATLEDAHRDPEAERLIRDGLRKPPTRLTRWCRPCWCRMKRSSGRTLASASSEGRRAKRRGAAPTRALSAGFATAFRQTRGSRLGCPRYGRPTRRRCPPAWNTGTPSPQPMHAPQPMPGAAGGAAMPSGGSFLGNAAAAAAGVIGGSMLLSGIRSMMGNQHGAQAALDPASGTSGSSPWGGSSGGELSREAGPQRHRPGTVVRRRQRQARLWRARRQRH